MKVTVVEPVTGVTLTLDVGEDMQIRTFRSLLQADFKIESERQQLFVKGRLINALSNNNKTLKDINVNDGDVIVLIDILSEPCNQTSLTDPNLNTSGTTDTTASAFSDLLRNITVANQMRNSGIFSESSGRKALVDTECATLKQRALQEPQFIDALEGTEPEVAAALRKKNDDTLRAAVLQTIERRANEQKSQAEKLKEAITNPMNPESQALLFNQIQQQRIDESYAHAQEFLPESFGNVFMLYVKIEVNSIPLKAFIDSGAQSTIMSRQCAERCGLMRLVDRRFHGIAQGVGTTRIVGRIHVVQIKMGTKFFAASVTVLEDDKVEFLFGLDLLKRHQCLIDLKRNLLKIEDEELPFLSEKESKGGLFSFGSVDGCSEMQKAKDVQEEPSLTTCLNSTAAAAITDTYTSTNSLPSVAGSDSKEQSIKRLVELGFSRTSAISALEQSNWNVEYAASFLFH